MRIVFDALGSTEMSGGMRLHSTELIRAWCETWPRDEVTVLGPAWVEGEFSDRARVVRWPNERAVERAFGQLMVAPRVAHTADADALVSLSPIVSPLSRRFTICFQHDWRHKVNPHEFPLHQRAYRKLWELSARYASVNACISTKAAAETGEYTRARAIAIVPNGWDHARRWPAHSRADDRRQIVTYGHHNNKRPELAIQAMRVMRDRGWDDLDLVVLGARGEYARDLSDLASRLGVDDVVLLPGFVEESTYQQLVSTAAAIVMPSSDEGFGLPVAEALYFGIPAVVTTDSGMPEIFGPSVAVASPTPESIADVLSEELRSPSSTRTTPARTGWVDAAAALRSLIARADTREHSLDQASTAAASAAGADASESRRPT